MDLISRENPDVRRGTKRFRTDGDVLSHSTKQRRNDIFIRSYMKVFRRSLFVIDVLTTHYDDVGWKKIGHSKPRPKQLASG